MRNSLLYILLLFFLLQVSCKKDEPPPTSGTVTIDNTRTLGQTYYVYGFLFSKAQKVSTLSDPYDVLTVDAYDVHSSGTADSIYFDAHAIKEQFFLFGKFANEATASTEFKNLVSFSSPPWKYSPVTVRENQIWLFRTSKDKYAKIRIIKTVAGKKDVKPFAECTFEWEYQPDGTLTFPGK